MFYLKQYDKELMAFDILTDRLEGQYCKIKYIREENRQFFPIGLKLTDKGLMDWLKTRIIPKNREFADAFLARNGLNHRDTEGILRVCKGLSLNDSYWIVEDNGVKFSDYDLFEHDFLKVLSLLAYTGYGSSKAGGFSSSPEFTTQGMLKKGWRRLQGKTLLYKGGTSGGANTGKEPYSEYYAAQIAAQMGIFHVPYGLSMWKHCLCSTCELFCDIDHSYVPMFRFLEESSLRTAASFLASLGESYTDAFADMLVFDALIYNEDRHFGNFGLLVDNKTNMPCGFAPLFDNGLSLFNYAMPEDIVQLDRYAKTRLSAYGIPFETIVSEFISPRQKAMLRRMIDFRFTRHPSYNLPEKRLNAIEKHLQKRVRELMDTDTGKR